MVAGHILCRSSSEFQKNKFQNRFHVYRVFGVSVIKITIKIKFHLLINDRASLRVADHKFQPLESTLLDRFSQISFVRSCFGYLISIKSRKKVWTMIFIVGKDQHLTKLQLFRTAIYNNNLMRK